MTLGTEFFRLRDSPEGSSRRRLIIIGAVGVTCLLLLIHHIRLEVAARHSSTEVAARQIISEAGGTNSSSEQATRTRLEHLESRYEALAKSLGWSKSESIFNSWWLVWFWTKILLLQRTVVERIIWKLQAQWTLCSKCPPMACPMDVFGPLPRREHPVPF